MTPDQWILVVGGGVVTILNAGIAFFLRSIYGDFRSLVAKVNDHSERLAVIEFRLSQFDGRPVPARHAP